MPRINVLILYILKVTAMSHFMNYYTVAEGHTHTHTHTYAIKELENI